MNAPPQKWPNVLVLVRHGQSVYNEERERINRGILQTYTTNVKEARNADIPLSALGEEQAQKTAIYLKQLYPSLDTIFASPFKRASDTARIIAQAYPETSILVEERIREKEFGIAEGLTPDEIRTRFPWEYERKLKEKKYYYRPIGGESYTDVNLRIWSFLTTLVREHAQQNILIVSHSAVMLSFRKHLEKLSEDDILRIDHEDRLDNCSIIAYHYDPSLQPKLKLKLAFYNKKAW